jgi:hypothetical protein
VSSARQFFLCTKLMANFVCALTIVDLTRLRVRTLTRFRVLTTPLMNLRMRIFIHTSTSPLAYCNFECVIKTSTRRHFKHLMVKWNGSPCRPECVMHKLLFRGWWTIYFATFYISSLPSSLMTYVFTTALWRTTWSTYVRFFNDLRRRAWSYALKKVEYCGYTVFHGQPSVSTKKVEAVAVKQVPTTLKEVRSFVHFCNFYARFSRHISDLTTPLTDFRSKSQRKKLRWRLFVWKPLRLSSYGSFPRHFWSFRRSARTRRSS